MRFIGRQTSGELWRGSVCAAGGPKIGLMQTIVGRFAPSPTGPLHAGSLVAALASWLDVRARGGRWLLRIEDVDTPRCRRGAAEQILAQLAGCGLHADEPPVWQSQRHAAYEAALSQLTADGHVYPCACSRREIDAALAAAGRPHHGDDERIYPGTCRLGLYGRPARALRLHTGEPGTLLHWHDRRLGAQQQDVAADVGDFVLRRADGLWAYQLAVVVDDGAQGITDVVRGEDLTDNTARQILLQRQLGLPQPRYLHTPLLRMADGRKLSKQHGAPAIEPGPAALREALLALSLQAEHPTIGELLAAGIEQWRRTWCAEPAPPVKR
jgi:glutamyl-Q tRNA(Asp) synthetase